MIIGKLIPAATGLKKYRGIEIEPSEPLPAAMFGPGTDAELLAALEEIGDGEGLDLASLGLGYEDEPARAARAAGRARSTGRGRSRSVGDGDRKVPVPAARRPAQRSNLRLGACAARPQESRGELDCVLPGLELDRPSRRRATRLDSREHAERVRATEAWKHEGDRARADGVDRHVGDGACIARERRSVAVLRADDRRRQPITLRVGSRDVQRQLLQEPGTPGQVILHERRRIR